MINDKTVLALIPARGGSKGIKNKNIIDLAGKPLIAHTIIAAQKSIYIDAVMVSTDSDKIAEVARKNGVDVPFLRPSILATDKSKSIDVVIWAISELKKRGQEYDILVFLQPTSPFRDADDIDKALELFVQKECSSLVGVSEVDDHPVFIRTINKDGKLEKLIEENSTVRRQDLKKFYRVNGSLYINLVSEINSETSLNDNEIGFILKNSHAVDIDDMDDLNYARYLCCKKVFE